MVLLSLASKQIWPQVLAVGHLKPERVFLLYSQDANESQGPAQRLKRFFDDSGLVPKGGTRLELIPDADFIAIERRLDGLQTKNQLPLADCVVNFTGGNKLMEQGTFNIAEKDDKVTAKVRHFDFSSHTGATPLQNFIKGLK